MCNLMGDLVNSTLTVREFLHLCRCCLEEHIGSGFGRSCKKEEERPCNIRPNLDGPVVAHECCVHMFNTTFLVEQGWSQLISLCPPAIAPSG